MPKTSAPLPKTKFWALSEYHLKCPFYRLFSYSYKCNLPKISHRMPKIPAPLPKTYFKLPKILLLMPKIKFLAFSESLYKCPFYRLFSYSYKCNLPKTSSECQKYLPHCQKFTSKCQKYFPKCQKHLLPCQKSNFWHFTNIPQAPCLQAF